MQAGGTAASGSGSSTARAATAGSSSSGTATGAGSSAGGATRASGIGGSADIMDVESLAALRRHHPAWRLLGADSAPLVASFLHRVFVADNVRTIGEEALAESLEDDLFRLRRSDPGAYPRSARQYLTDWADPARGWLRRFYPPGSDEPSYDLTPAAEKALRWLPTLSQRSFIGTESRLLTAFDLLRQIVEGSQADARERIATLQRRRAEIDAEIARIESGDIPLLEPTAVRDRFQQFVETARGLLADFREVEENFRTLDRGVRERIAGWDGARGALLDDVMGRRDAISDSDQGVSFQAFWAFLMSADRQDEFARLLGDALSLEALRGSDGSLRYVVHDWLTAGDAVQRTVAALSQQLRRFLDDQAYLENRRIAELSRSIEAHALALRDQQPAGPVMAVHDGRTDIAIPMARRLYEPSRPVRLDDAQVSAGEPDGRVDGLFDQVVVDPAAVRAAVARALVGRDQATLGEVVAGTPLTSGLAELVGYLAVADEDGAAFLEQRTERLVWSTAEGGRAAELPLVIFTPGDPDPIDLRRDVDGRADAG